MSKAKKTLTALCLINSAGAYALGIGEISTYSSLNQVLNAKIPLVGSKGEDPSEINISLASRETFKKAGIDRPQYLSELKFTPIVDKNGFINITVSSQESIQEPFVNFILAMEWSNGRTLKEFTILLDPPLTMPGTQTSSIALATSKDVIASPTSSRSNSTNDESLMTRDQAHTEYGPTKSTDNVWNIAKELIRNKPNITHEQMMMALYNNNPSAFYKKNVNALKKGKILSIPSHRVINQQDPAQAKKDFRQQNILWSQRTSNKNNDTHTASKPDTLAKDSDNKEKLETATEKEAKLKLLTPQQTTDTLSSEGSSTTLENDATAPNQQANIAIEMATTLEEENKEVKSRLNDLETQVEKLQRLLTLKDEQLAKIQTKAAQENNKKSADETVNTTAINNDDENNMLLYAGGGLLAILLVLFIARRRKENADQPFPTENTPLNNDQKTINTDPELIEPANSDNSDTLIEEENFDDGSLLSEFTPSEFENIENTQEADPLTECDVYIAYGRYQQAEDLIQKALSEHPDNTSYQLKLLDVYFSSGNSEGFEQLAKELEGLKTTDPDMWNSINEMGIEVCPESSLFHSTQEDSSQIFDPAINVENGSSEEPEITIETPVEEDTEDKGEFEFDFDLIKPDQEISSDDADEAEEMEGYEMHENLLDDSGNDIETKLSLAQAYIDMEDLTSAKEALEEVLSAGNEDQKAIAQSMLDNL